jgi:methyl-accepting chemotaxis protein
LCFICGFACGAIVAPVVRDGTVKGVVSGDVTMDSVIANVKSIRPTPASFGMLIDSSGQIVAHPDAKLTLKPVSDLAPGLAGDKLAALFSAERPLQIEVNGSAKLLRAQAIPGTDWYVVVALDKAEATAGMRSLLTASVIALIVIAGIAAAIVAAVTAVSFQRLSNVRDAMGDIGSGEGDLTQRLPALGNDEVAQIARSFNTFIDKLSHVMRQIRHASGSVRVAANEIAAGTSISLAAPNRLLRAFSKPLRRWNRSPPRSRSRRAPRSRPIRPLCPRRKSLRAAAS